MSVKLQNNVDRYTGLTQEARCAACGVTARSRRTVWTNQGLVDLVQLLSEVESPANSDGSCKGDDSVAQHLVPARLSELRYKFRASLAACDLSPATIAPSHRVQARQTTAQHATNAVQATRSFRTCPAPSGCFPTSFAPTSICCNGQHHRSGDTSGFVAQTLRASAFGASRSSTHRGLKHRADFQSMASQPAGISKLAAVVWNDSTVFGAAALAPWSLVPSKTPAAKGLVQVLLYLAPVHKPDSSPGS